jgi:hypothetical protein
MLQVVRFEYLYSDYPCDLIGFNPEYIDPLLWVALSRWFASRLVLATVECPPKEVQTDPKDVKSAPLVSRSETRKAVEFPLARVKSRDRIISYLTRKHGGNVHDRHIAAFTSKSVSGGEVHLADLTFASRFWSAHAKSRSDSLHELQRLPEIVDG